MEVICTAKRVEQINDYLFIDIYNSNKIKNSMNEMRVNACEMSMRWNNKVWSIYRRNKSCDSLGEYRLRTQEEKNSGRDGFLTF